MRKGFYILIALLFCLPILAAEKKEKVFTVVLDAGHGGNDPGAVGKFSKEKDLNLTLVLELGKRISERYPEVNVIYTRSTDVFVALQQRANIANKNKADLFISIHTNAAKSKDAHGVETFILGTEKMDKNLDVAMRENAVIMLEKDYKETYQNFDPNSIDSYIMFELMQNSHMEQSLQFAEQIQKRFVSQLNRDDRGVRQAAFWVLLQTACPSVLFEMGFITNAEEEKYLNQPASIARMADALTEAFDAYMTRMTAKQEVRKQEPEQKPVTQDKPAVHGQPVQQPAHQQASAVSNQPSAPQENSTPDVQAEHTPVTYYAIQIRASKEPLAPDDARFKGQACDTIHAGEWIKYYVHPATDRATVAAQLPELRKLFPDCWIISFTR